MALLITDMEVACHKGTRHTMAVLWSIRQVSRVTHCNHSDKSMYIRWCFNIMQ